MELLILLKEKSRTCIYHTNVFANIKHFDVKKYEYIVTE